MHGNPMLDIRAIAAATRRMMLAPPLAASALINPNAERDMERDRTPEREPDGCVHCGDPCRPNSRYCSRSCAREEDGHNLPEPDEDDLDEAEDDSDD